MKRPLSVWIVEFLLILFCLIYFCALAIGVPQTVMDLWETSRSVQVIMLCCAEIFLKFTGFCFFIACIVAIWQRRPQGRILGLLALLIVFVFFTYAKFYSTPVGQRALPQFEIVSKAEQGGAVIASTLLIIGFWVLFFRFGFSAKARAYFKALK